MRIDLFATRIHRAYFANGVVRLEFCVISPDGKGAFAPDAEPRPEDITFTVSLPLAGFTRSLGTLRNLYVDLVQRGVLRKPEEREGGRRGQEGARPQEIAPDDFGGQPLV